MYSTKLRQYSEPDKPPSPPSKLRILIASFFASSCFARGIVQRGKVQADSLHIHFRRLTLCMRFSTLPCGEHRSTGRLTHWIQLYSLVEGALVVSELPFTPMCQPRSSISYTSRLGSFVIVLAVCNTVLIVLQSTFRFTIPIASLEQGLRLE
ncbi:uncharacterized protein C8Q71DRAFT_778162 [Rhodofomes roseus]|uniref:Uncharacterized protein n=1 Tax=Rhodofomes roseus TaxID=34475 RepID=A0ABQ8K5K7_9APHY|nr:uncharacterized protein C8Q71DRAFT_778162 [Rhodofomes roseus]KAH9832257.1 hypothetical protein C8Q71DRAFT_778162 [Rhodofomes roseus]